MKTDDLAFVRNNELAIDRYARRPLPTTRDILAVLFRQRWHMVIAFVLVVVGIALSGVLTPTYEAQMKILALRQRSDVMVSPTSDAPHQYDNDQVSEEDLNSEVELLNSDDLLRNVVLATGLSGNTGPATDSASELRIAEAVRKLSKDLKIEPLRKSNVISVSYHARSPKMAEKVLQQLASAYMEKHLQVHRSSGELSFFDQQAEQYKQGMDQAQAKLTNFTKGTGVVSAELERDAALHQADIFDASAREAQTSVLETEQRVSALKAELQSIKPRITTVTRTSDNPYLLEQLKSTLLTLQLKQADLLARYQPSYPLVQEVNLQIAEAKASVSEAESKPLLDEASDQNPDYRWVQAELTKAQADLVGLKTRAAAAAAVAAKYHAQAENLGQSMVTQQNLQQAAKTQEDNYLLYERKREEARISSALDRGGFLNVALAEQPLVPALPKRSPLSWAFITLLLAGTVSLCTAFAFDYMDPTFRTPDELAVYLGAPVLAALPKAAE